jgi:KDO2-lipid IV(A) lauroyltransferase
MGERLEAFGVAVIYALFAVLPANAASAFGGWIGRRLGPRFGRSRVARKNLRMAFPSMNEGEVEATIASMWENIGRGFAEYPHLAALMRNVEVVGAANAQTMAEDDKPAIVISGHIGNWEIMPPKLREIGLPIAVVYRAPNNPFVDRLLHRARSDGALSLIAKGGDGAREILKSLREGGHVGMLIDQKSSDGPLVPLFGRGALTTPAPALLALRFDCPILPVFTHRIEGTRFRMTVLPPFTLESTGDKERDIEAGLARINALLEEWIAQRPAQWLWLHRRWPES